MGIVRFLMGIENPDDEAIRAIEGAVNWFERSRLEAPRTTLSSLRLSRDRFSQIQRRKALADFESLSVDL